MKVALAQQAYKQAQAGYIANAAPASSICTVCPAEPSEESPVQQIRRDLKGSLQEQRLAPAAKGRVLHHRSFFQKRISGNHCVNAFAVFKHNFTGFSDGSDAFEGKKRTKRS